MRAVRMTPHRSTTRLPLKTLPAVALLCLAPVLTPTPSAHADTAPADTVPAAPADTVRSWQADLTRVDEDDAGVHHADEALRLTGDAPHDGSAGTGGGHGIQILAPHTLDRPVNRVRAVLAADVPEGADVTVEVRGRRGTGPWTEWREAGADESDAALLPRAVDVVQVRLTLRDATGRLAVRGLELHADTDPDAPQETEAAAPYTARVFATREGLVGHTTANGHVIRPNDRFVALPSRRGLSSKGGREYSVRVCGPVRCETAPVWDVGPWNIRDDYWNPSSVRETFRDLPRGRPQAQAAYQDGHNGGRDGFGRRVLNPAGIDLADGTFHNVGLRDNGWVTVTFLWTTRSAEASEDFAAEDAGAR
ncbi:hypothetical protein [Streptomyces megasporus]|uniref:hypothetical protein n=1 Tax=Streptomyces megasporus TaxID=44060 RepID=UPI0006898D22|nr:hypothetical protein [Streptomyces megasporus]